MPHIEAALALILNIDTLIAVIVGTILGLIIGALPGLGSVVAITVALPFTYSLQIGPSIALILSIYCASIYGGSIAAILINTPGTPQSAATALDGFPLAQAGKSDLAIGWATLASVFGGLFSLVVLVFLAPQLAAVALRFGPIETFALVCLALTCIATVSEGNTIKGLAAGILGLMLATVGSDPMSGDMRFTFDFFPLTAGIALLPVLVGLFALSEVFVRVAERARHAAPALAGRSGFAFPSWADWRARFATLIKSSAMGSFIGVLPGTGAAVAAFISYAEAKRSGRFRKEFGKGEPEGIVSAEAANNAVTGGALVPTLSLGIPGDAVTAIMMSALIMQGVQPGVRLFVDNPDVVYACFLLLGIANIGLFLVAVGGARLFTMILKVPEAVLLNLVVVLSVLGAYGARGNPFDLLVMLIAGIIGFFMRWNGFPTAPVVIGLVLGRLFEESLRQGLVLTDGRVLGLVFDKPVATFLLAITVLVLAFPAIRALYEQRRGRAQSP